MSSEESLEHRILENQLPPQIDDFIELDPADLDEVIKERAERGVSVKYKAKEVEYDNRYFNQFIKDVLKLIYPGKYLLEERTSAMPMDFSHDYLLAKLNGDAEAQEIILRNLRTFLSVNYPRADIPREIKELQSSKDVEVIPFVLFLNYGRYVHIPGWREERTDGLAETVASGYTKLDKFTPENKERCQNEFRRWSLLLLELLSIAEEAKRNGDNIRAWIAFKTTYYINMEIFGTGELEDYYTKDTVKEFNALEPKL